MPDPMTPSVDASPAQTARLSADVQRLRMRLADVTRDYTAMGEALRFSLTEVGGLARDQPGLVCVLERYDEWKQQGNIDG